MRMTTKSLLVSACGILALGGFGYYAAGQGWLGDSGAIPHDEDDIAGVVRGAAGPEAGVWVIAETTDLPTKLAKIVVTDDQGRYVLPGTPRTFGESTRP